MMRTLYLSQQGSCVHLKQELLQVLYDRQLIQEVALPTLEQVMVFGRSHLTVDVIRECLKRNIPIAYLSRQGYCYGRVIAIEQGYRRLGIRQKGMPDEWRMQIARQLVWAKVLNSRVLLMRQIRQRPTPSGEVTLSSLAYLAEQILKAPSAEVLRGLEGSAAYSYFQELGLCLQKPGFSFLHRTRRPPTNPVNAMLSFGYMLLWNHLLTVVDLQDLDPYEGCFHASSERHAALVSDLIEPFRSPIVDSLVLWLVNKGVIQPEKDFDYRNGGCFLGELGRKKYLQAFVQRMEGRIQVEDGEQPRWDLLMQQVRHFKRCVYDPEAKFQPYRIR